jgi:hypothetical protein
MRCSELEADTFLMEGASSSAWWQEREWLQGIMRTVQDCRFPQQWLWRWVSSDMWYWIVSQIITYVSEGTGPEDRLSTFLIHISRNLPDYMMSHPHKILIFTRTVCKSIHKTKIKGCLLCIAYAYKGCLTIWSRVLWHVEPLHGHNQSYKQQLLLSNGYANNRSTNTTNAMQQRNGVSYAVHAGCYKQGQLGAAGSLDNHWGSPVVRSW